MKQLNTSLKLYQSDADDAYPVPDTNALAAITETSGFSYMGVRGINETRYPGQRDYMLKSSYLAIMSPYVKSRDIYRDPGDPLVDTSTNPGDNKNPSSYRLRFYLVAGWMPYVNTPGTALFDATAPWRQQWTDSRFKEPANSIVMHANFPYWDYKLVPNPYTASGTGWDPQMTMTCGFADSHAKRLPLSRSFWKTEPPAGVSPVGFDLNWPRRCDPTATPFCFDGATRMLNQEPDVD